MLLPVEIFKVVLLFLLDFINVLEANYMMQYLHNLGYCHKLVFKFVQIRQKINDNLPKTGLINIQILSMASNLRILTNNIFASVVIGLCRNLDENNKNQSYINISSIKIMSVKAKLQRLLTKGDSFFALTYSWSDNKLQVHQTEEEYFDDLTNLRNDQGVCKRAQCYLPKFIKLRGKKYAVYLTSYGDVRKWKFIFGENPIAKEFGICMFDYVYLFLQPIAMAEQKIELRIKHLQETEKTFQAQRMKIAMKKLFGKQYQEQSKEKQMDDSENKSEPAEKHLDESTNNQIHKNSNQLIFQYGKDPNQAHILDFLSN